MYLFARVSEQSGRTRTEVVTPPQIEVTYSRSKAVKILILQPMCGINQLRKRVGYRSGEEVRGNAQVGLDLIQLCVLGWSRWYYIPLVIRFNANQCLSTRSTTRHTPEVRVYISQLSRGTHSLRGNMGG